MKMKTRLNTIFSILIVAILASSLIALANGGPNPLGITPTPSPGGNLTVGVWTNKSSYTVGETMQVFFSVNQPAYVYIYDIQPDSVVRRIFPNAFSQNNYVPAGTHTLPDNPSYQLSVTYPAGVEQLQIIASLTPLSLTPHYYGEPFPLATPGDIQGHIMGVTPTPTWVMGWTSFTISAPYYGHNPSPPCSPPCTPPFFGWWCPGGSWHWEDGQWHFGSPSSGCCWTLGPDGKWRFSIRFMFNGD